MKSANGLSGLVLNQSYNVSIVEVRNGDEIRLARKGGEYPIINPHLPPVDGDGVDGRVAAMLPVGIDLDGPHREDERAILPPAVSIRDAIFDERFSGMGDGCRPEFDSQRRPSDARYRQCAIEQRLTDGRARRRSAQNSAQSEKRGDLSAIGLRFEIAIFIEKRFLGSRTLAHDRPVDLATEERLRVEVAAARPSRTLELSEGHPVFVQEPNLEFVDNGSLWRTRLMHR
jgi:hypothetical protein